MATTYQVCTNCVMDTSDPDIMFDASGVCSHCKRYEVRARTELFYDEAGQQYFARLVEQMKEEGRGNDYDCVLGVSGGVDSTMVAYIVRKLGLRALAIHMDNGWNSELAVQNIEVTLRTLNLDLHTEVVDWEDFKDLHLAFLRSSIPNSEIPTDHAILATLYRVAVKHNVRYIMGGGNIVTEAIMPTSWMYDAKDLRLLRSIHRRYGTTRLKTFPTMTYGDFAYWTFVKRIRMIPILNYVPYNKKEAMATLERELGWRPYEAKHYESIYTRFFQGYILPRKFGIDKRRPHLSTLICSGQLTRPEALAELSNDPYPPDKLVTDREFVLKKLGVSDAEFNGIMGEPPRSHREFASSEWLMSRIPGAVAMAKKVAQGRAFVPRGAASPEAARTNVHLYPTPFRFESRILKETKSIADDGLFERILIAGVGAPGSSEREELDEKRSVWRVPVVTGNFGSNRAWKALGRLEWYARLYRGLSSTNVSYMNCHGLSSLPIGVLFKGLRGTRVVYDTHELETEKNGMHGIQKWLAKRLERRLIGHVDGVVVVGTEIGQWYEQEYGVKNVKVVRNIPSRSMRTALGDAGLRRQLGIGPDELVFIYQGLLAEGRGLRLILDAFAHPHTERERHVVLMGYGPLEHEIRDRAERHQNIHFLPAVPPHQLPSFTREADVGLCVIEDRCLSYRYAMPNKLFEYVTSATPVIVSDLPEMARFVDEHACGWTVALRDHELRALINGISRGAIETKRAAAASAAHQLSWEGEVARLLDLYELPGPAVMAEKADSRLPGGYPVTAE